MPDEAAQAFPESADAAAWYADLLAGDGIVRGLIGPREADRVWERHVLPSALLGALVPQGAGVADLGSGAGLPGIPLALARADVDVTLVEPLLRRTTFLDDAIAGLAALVPDLPGRLRVHRGRAEQLHGSAVFDVVTARALAPLERLVGWAAPLLAVDGQVLAIKGEAAAAEIEAASAPLRKAGLVASLERISGPGGPLTVVRLVRG